MKLKRVITLDKRHTNYGIFKYRMEFLPSCDIIDELFPGLEDAYGHTTPLYEYGSICRSVIGHGNEYYAELRTRENRYCSHFYIKDDEVLSYILLKFGNE